MAPKKASLLLGLLAGKPKGKASEDSEYYDLAGVIFDSEASTTERSDALKEFIHACMDE